MLTTYKYTKDVELFYKVSDFTNIKVILSLLSFKNMNIWIKVDAYTTRVPIYNRNISYALSN